MQDRLNQHLGHKLMVVRLGTSSVDWRAISLSWTARESQNNR